VASKIYSAPESVITFQDSGGSAVLALQNLAAGAGIYSNRHDRGAGSRAAWMWLRFVWQMETAGVVGETVEVYLSSWSEDGTYSDGGLSSTGTTLTSDMRRNLGNPALIGIIDKTATATNIIASGLVFVPTRYISAAVWDASADNLENTANASIVSLTPYPFEQQ
jgi:hypothetical protein